MSDDALKTPTPSSPPNVARESWWRTPLLAGLFTLVGVIATVLSTSSATGAADRRAEADRASNERRADADRASNERRAEADRAAGERRAEEDRASTERRAQEDRASSERRAASELLAAERRQVLERKLQSIDRFSAACYRSIETTERILNELEFTPVGKAFEALTAEERSGLRRIAVEMSESIIAWESEADIARAFFGPDIEIKPLRTFEVPLPMTQPQLVAFIKDNEQTRKHLEAARTDCQANTKMLIDRASR